MDIQKVHSLVRIFINAIYYEDRNVNKELADALGWKKYFSYGTLSEFEKKYNMEPQFHITPIGHTDMMVGFVYDKKSGCYMMFCSKDSDDQREIFEYRNHNDQCWITWDQFHSFEGLNAVSVAQKFLSGNLDNSLHVVTEGLAFDLIEREKKIETGEIPTVLLSELLQGK